MKVPNLKYRKKKVFFSPTRYTPPRPRFSILSPKLTKMSTFSKISKLDCLLHSCARNITQTHPIMNKNVFCHRIDTHRSFCSIICQQKLKFVVRLVDLVDIMWRIVLLELRNISTRFNGACYKATQLLCFLIISTGFFQEQRVQSSEHRTPSLNYPLCVGVCVP